MKYNRAPFPPVIVWFRKTYGVPDLDHKFEISPEDYNETTKLQLVNKIKEGLAYGREPLAE